MWILKNKWFQIIAGVLILLATLYGLFRYVKHLGRAERDAERAAIFVEKDKKIAKLEVESKLHEKRAEAFEASSEKWQEALKKSKALSEANMAKIERDSELRLKIIEENYEKEIGNINNLDACGLCNEQCRRADERAKKDKDFEKYRCEPKECDTVCAG